VQALRPDHGLCREGELLREQDEGPDLPSSETALFFAGMSTRLRAEKARLAALAVGCVHFVGTVVWIGTLPVGAVL
jgi:hypothetical protein